MTKVIWSGDVFYDGQSRHGRVVRDADGGDLVFEVAWGTAAMGEAIWRHSDNGPFREFLIAAGTLMEAAGAAVGDHRSEHR